MASRGWIKLHRKLRENPIYTNSRAIHCWIECLLRANHKEKAFYQGREKVVLKPGQFLMGREEFGQTIGISSSTAWYWINEFEVNSMLDTKRTAKGTVITIYNWENYQAVDSKVDIRQTADEQQKNTNKNVKNDKNDKKNTNISSKLEKKVEEVMHFFNEHTNRNYYGKSHKEKIRARIRDDNLSVEDAKLIIRFKYWDWKDDEKMSKYIAPGTFFRPTKYEKYLNQAKNPPKKVRYM